MIMPKLPLLSVSDQHQPFCEYAQIELDLSNLEQQIDYMLEQDRWKTYGAAARKSYIDHHTPEKCFEHYHDILIRHAPIQPRIIMAHSAEPYYEAWRKRPI
jgi:hypothetical protein